MGGESTGRVCHKVATHLVVYLRPLGLVGIGCCHGDLETRQGQTWIQKDTAKLTEIGHQQELSQTMKTSECMCSFRASSGLNQG